MNEIDDQGQPDDADGAPRDADLDADLDAGRDADLAADLDPDEIDLDDELAALLADPTMWEEPGAELEDRVVAAVRSEAALGEATPASVTDLSTRRGWLRPALLGAAAALVFVFGAVVTFSALSGVDDTETFAAELISTGRLPDVSGEIEISALQSGLRIDLEAQNLPRRDDGRYYEAWLLTVDGNLVPVGTFHEGDGVILWAGVGLDRVEAFTITLEEITTGQSPLQGSSGEVVLRTLVDG